MAAASSCLAGCFSFGGAKKDKSKNLPTPSADEPVVSNDRTTETAFERPAPLDKPVDPEATFDSPAHLDESKDPPTPSTDEPVVSNDKTDEPVDPKIKLQEIFAQYRQDRKEDQLQESLKALFAKYDADGNKVITRSEFRQVMEDLDVPYLRHSHFFSASDEDASGSVDCEEFVRLMVNFAKTPM